MPTYVYKCAHCGHMFEARQRMSEDPLSDCPRCDEDALRRVINSVGIVFKGSGFYVTDNRNGKNGSASSNGSTDSAAKTEKSTETTTESKTAASTSGKETSHSTVKNS